MHAIVTGGAGFIGSHIVEALLQEGNRVTVVDSLHTGSEKNLAFAKGNARFRFIQANSGGLTALSLEKPDCIFHQGVYSSSPMYKKDPLLAGKAIEEFIALLEYARKNDCPVVFASSSSLYNGLQPPHREDMPIPVSDYYTEARLAMERLAQLHHSWYGQRIIALRYFSVYGPREESKGQYANLITQFLWALQKNEVPVIYGDGKQARDFVFVSDVARANLLAWKSTVRSGVFNVGTGKSTTINEMLALLNTKLGRNIPAKYVENKIKNYVPHTQASTEKAEREIGFRAEVTLDSGIEQLIHYTRNRGS